MLALAPLLVGLFVAVAAAAYVVKKKHLATSLCVQHGAGLQLELSKLMDQLERMNPEAGRLRIMRTKADLRLKLALRTRNPKLIAAAKAHQLTVILKQRGLRSRQLQVLRMASLERAKTLRELSAANRRLRFSSPQGHFAYHLPLAVRPAPQTSLSPDYIQSETFTTHQAQHFSFNVDLNPPFLTGINRKTLQQTTRCSVSLERKEKQWRVLIVADNRRSKWRSSYLP